MRPRYCCLLLLILLLTVNLLGADFDSGVEKKMFELVNIERTSRGLPAFKWSDHLRDSARKHTEKLAEHGTLSHQFSDEPNVQARIAATGLHFSASAENVASSSGASPLSPAEELHQALMNSPGHRANILNPKYTAIGVGVVHTGDSYFATQNFALATDDYSSEDAEKLMGESLNTMRKQHRLGAVSIVQSRGLREAICKQAETGNLSARALYLDEGFHGVTAAVTTSVSDIPERLDKIILSPQLTKIAIGACFRVSPKYPGGMYWYGFAY